MVQRKPVACDIYGIAERLSGFTVSGELGLGHRHSLISVSHRTVLYPSWRLHASFHFASLNTARSRGSRLGTHQSSAPCVTS